MNHRKLQIDAVALHFYLFVYEYVKTHADEITDDVDPFEYVSKLFSDYMKKHRNRTT